MLFLVLLLAALAGAATATVLTVRGIRAAFRRGERDRPGWLRTVALLAGAGTVAMYAWGLLHLGYAVLRAEDGGAGSFPIEPCREAGPQRASQVDGYEVSYLPIRFECRVSGGGTYVTSSVPGYVNPSATALGLLTATCGILATTTTQREPSPPVA
ncbi:hypothetical protein JOD64_001814 [Micromonospora luteifusca]|uniref:DUF3592 domain-containing protein n=1 Tax=Micromonospora luteifusca TaxID=709860 RepID=A0ABS2LQY0_9ACTN|nr:hypothetical protein [Micromonospora luteifusca]MBM7490592.1 hypothetical protein [Micromonospora luteifusca]